MRFGKTLEIWIINPDYVHHFSRPFTTIITTIGEGLHCPCGYSNPICNTCGTMLIGEIPEDIFFDSSSMSDNEWKEYVYSGELEKQYILEMMHATWMCFRCDGDRTVM